MLVLEKINKKKKSKKKKKKEKKKKIMGDEFSPEELVGKVRRISEWFGLKREDLKRVAEYLEVELPSEMKKGVVSEEKFDVGRNMEVVPTFSEQEVDVFFLSFEKVANSLKWPSEYWSLLAQSAMTGRAREVYVALDQEKSADYKTVKELVLNAYELVPESYRQRFRGLQREVGESHLEFARKKEMAFDKWCRAQKVKQEYSELRQLVLMEEFKRSVTPGIRTYLEGHKVESLQKVAILADEYELSHRGNFGGSVGYQGAQEEFGVAGKGGGMKMRSEGPAGVPSGPTCHYVLDTAER